MLPGKPTKHMTFKKLLKTAFAFSLFAFAVFFVIPFFTNSGIVFAGENIDSFGLEAVGETVPFGQTDIRVTIMKIIRVMLGLLGIISISIMIYAGYLIMTSGGEADKITLGKKWMINATIGLAIILSSVAIVQFVLNALSDATGFDTGQRGVATAPRFDSFSGSGSLGRIIEDHYPEKNQKNVKRNTKIVVTFSEAVDPNSIIEDTNGNGIIGDCLDPETVDNFSFELHCDRAKDTALSITKEGESDETWQASGFAVYENNNEVKTILFRPLSLLGSKDGDILHIVRLIGGNNGIKNISGNNIFENSRKDYYEWKFETNTDIDLDPPYITRVTPENGRKVSKNSILQIHFNEAMDPTQVQGFISATSPFTNIVMSNQITEGEWRITNGYKTIEFVSNSVCGENSCGDEVYCLDVSCEEDKCTEEYKILVRTAKVIGDKFESIPFSGVMDMAGNALDGNHDSIPDNRPEPLGGKQILENELVADNYHFIFDVVNMVDLTSPYVEQIFPSIDAQNIIGGAPVDIYFNRQMWMRTLRGSELEEYAAEGVRNQDVLEKLANMDEIWFYRRAEVVTTLVTEEEKTKLSIFHRDFGANNLDVFYFTSIPSTVKDLSQNCIYPGRGPYTEQSISGISPACVYVDGENDNVNCVPVNTDGQTDTGCVETFTRNRQGVLVSDLNNCRNKLETISSNAIAR
jgi:hypothetical protein